MPRQHSYLLRVQPNWRVLFCPWDLFTGVFQNFRTKPVSDLVLNTSVHFEIFSSYLDFVQSTAIISLIVYIWLSCAFPKESPGKYDYDYFYLYHALIFSFIWDKFMRYCHFYCKCLVWSRYPKYKRIYIYLKKDCVYFCISFMFYSLFSSRERLYLFLC